MKATIDIPDELYRRVKAKSALEGRPIRAVAIELFQSWLNENGNSEPQHTQQVPASPNESGLTRRQRAELLPKPAWLENWFRAADEAFKDAPPGPTAREILEQDRSRLDRR